MCDNVCVCVSVRACARWGVNWGGFGTTQIGASYHPAIHNHNSLVRISTPNKNVPPPPPDAIMAPPTPSSLDSPPLDDPPLLYFQKHPTPFQPASDSLIVRLQRLNSQD